MSSDDFLRESVERSQRDLTRKRRSERSRRRQLYALTGLLSALALVLCLPSLVSHSSMGRSMLVRTLAEQGLHAEVESMRVGWITPLRVTGLSIQGDAGTELIVEQLDIDLTVPDLMRSLNELGDVTLRGVSFFCSVNDQSTSLEKDLQAILETPGQGGSISANVILQDLTVTITDAVSGGTWQVSQSSGEVSLGSEELIAAFSGVLTEPSGDGGSVQGKVNLPFSEESPSDWKVEIQTESLPLSVMSLVRRRFPEAASAIPYTLSGDATGAISIADSGETGTKASIERLRIRNLRASDHNSRVWNNALATIDGQLVIMNNRVIGHQLRASTDFASATIDGAFSRTFSLVGANDNPLQWLDAIDGTATADVDLAAFDRSLPGLIPLRDDAQVVSGTINARLDSTSQPNQRRSELSVRTTALRGRAQGRPIVIDPIEVTATVSSDQGTLTAESFRWTSNFGTAQGHGNARAGSVDFDLDFGRLSSILQPIVTLSNESIGGTANGNLGWSSAPDGVWRMSGTANGTGLDITLPGGQSLRRPFVSGQVAAVGRWQNEGLQELSQVNVSLNSEGLNLAADLVEPIASPSIAAMPFYIQGSGRLNTLQDTIGPWLPPELHQTSGGFTLNATAEWSAATTRVTSAAIELTNPRISYGGREFSQPNVKIHFDGEYLWPTGSLESRSFTIAGDAFSAAAKGSMLAGAVDMEVKWRAKLERLQGSVQERITERNPAMIRQVAYSGGSSVDTNLWLVTGDCEGSVKLTTREQFLDIDMTTTGLGVNVIQPPQASSIFQTVGPPRPGTNASQTRPDARVVWSEPELTFDGRLSYDMSTHHIVADAVQVAGDWFATTLSGNLAWNQNLRRVELSGPARLRMNQVASRLSSLAGVDIQATGIHETPLSIHLVHGDDGALDFAVGGNLGWESGEVAGVAFGPATIPVQLNETTVSISQANIPVDQGRLRLAGQVHYRPGPLWMRVEPGPVADSIRLTPELTDRWLKYLAPLVAQTTRVDGLIGAEIDEAVIVFDQPEKTRVAGRLNVGGVNMNAGPLAQQIIFGIDQLKAISNPLSAQNATPANQILVSMPAQTIGFTVDHGIVTHDRLFMEIDRAQIVTSGRVSLDGQLQLVAQVPLDARWLGRDLQGLAGQTVTLPIDGTLSRPSLDSAGVRQVLTQLGAQAVQDTAENYLQQQLNRGLDKIFGR